MDYLAHLSKDRKLRPLLTEPLKLRERKNIPLRLCASIMSQQLSTKVAEVLFRRFLALYGKKEPTARQILDTSVETLRGIGLSGAKAAYVHNVARFCVEQKLTDRKLKGLENEALIDLLTGIKGIGRWTVEMLLMFTLAREDVFAPDDYGIQTAMKKLYGLEDLKGRALREAMLQISEKWAPYRTYACLHLWRWKDS